MDIVEVMLSEAKYMVVRTVGAVSLGGALFAQSVAGVIPSEEAPRPGGIPYPLFISRLANPNDYGGFANGGWDGFWYVGYDRAWIVQLSIPYGPWKKAFLGAKLGRQKGYQAFRQDPKTGRLRPILGRKTPYFGEIYISVNSTPAFRASNSFLLTTSDQIPLEPDGEMMLEGTGEARWFWTEIPLNALSLGRENFICLWSPTEGFVGISSSPILAAGYSLPGMPPGVWLNDAVRGRPPDGPVFAAYLCSTGKEARDKPGLCPEHLAEVKKEMVPALKTQLTATFEPAIAVRLVPEYAQSLTVAISGVSDLQKVRMTETLQALVLGHEIEEVWLEVNRTGRNWLRHGRPLYTPPFVFSIRAADFPEGRMMIRVGARDVWGNSAYSPFRKVILEKPE